MKEDHLILIGCRERLKTGKAWPRLCTNEDTYWLHSKLLSIPQNDNAKTRCSDEYTLTSEGSLRTKLSLSSFYFCSLFISRLNATSFLFNYLLSHERKQLSNRFRELSSSGSQNLLPFRFRNVHKHGLDISSFHLFSDICLSLAFYL